MLWIPTLCLLTCNKHVLGLNREIMLIIHQLSSETLFDCLISLKMVCCEFYIRTVKDWHLMIMNIFLEVLHKLSFKKWFKWIPTNHTFIAGLLTEPEGKSSVVMIWGYTVDTKKWEAHIIDFKDVIPRKCELQLLPFKLKTTIAELIANTKSISAIFKVTPAHWISQF